MNVNWPQRRWLLDDLGEPSNQPRAVRAFFSAGEPFDHFHAEPPLSRRLLYVACTRAREHLLLTGVAPVSQYLADFDAKKG